MTLVVYLKLGPVTVHLDASTAFIHADPQYIVPNRTPRSLGNQEPHLTRREKSTISRSFTFRNLSESRLIRKYITSFQYGVRRFVAH